jgi:hypothetical protein
VSKLTQTSTPIAIALQYLPANHLGQYSEYLQISTFLTQPKSRTKRHHLAFLCALTARLQFLLEQRHSPVYKFQQASRLCLPHKFLPSHQQLRVKVRVVILGVGGEMGEEAGIGTLLPENSIHDHSLQCYSFLMILILPIIPYCIHKGHISYHILLRKSIRNQRRDGL